MMLNVTRFVNLVLAGSLVGNEFGTKVAIHPSLERLSTPERIRAEQEVTRRYAAIMPFWMSSVIVSCLPVLGMLASTLIGNVPINNRVLELSPETDQEEFVELREHWDRLHTFRVLLNVAGLALVCVGALSRVDRR
jgi:hypothetical protein